MLWRKKLGVFTSTSEDVGSHHFLKSCFFLGDFFESDRIKVFFLICFWGLNIFVERDRIFVDAYQEDDGRHGYTFVSY